jgi:hypothetical protein
MDTYVALREILTNPGSFDGWLYLPPEPWTLETKGIFINLDDVLPGELEPLPDLVRAQKWQQTLDVASIEDVIEYARTQNPSVTTQELLQAFVYYTKNDAFMEL